MFNIEDLVLVPCSGPVIRKNMVIDTGDHKFRILSIASGSVCIIMMDTKRLIITSIAADELHQKVTSGQYKLFTEKTRIVDLKKFSEIIQKKYKAARNLVDFLEQVFQERYEDICGNLSSPEIQDKIRELGFSDNRMRMILRHYLQSGRSDISLIDGKALRNYNGKPYSYTRKTGRPPVVPGGTGCILSAQDRNNFREGVERLTTHTDPNRKLTIMQAYNDMLAHHYTVYENGDCLYPRLTDQVPSFRQFYYYFTQQASVTDRIGARFGSKFLTNDYRLYTGNVRTGVYGPGDTFEIDAYETNIAVMEPDGMGGRTAIGRAVLYLIIDVFTTLIVGFYVGLENNSVIGLTNALYSLNEDKKKVIAQLGLEGTVNPNNFVSGYKPLAFRVDNGSEFTSDEFKRICSELNVEILTVPPGTGSMKSTVEHCFYQFQTHYEVVFYKKGTITDEYMSRHHQQTKMTLDDIRKMMMIEISRHNESIIKTRKLPKEMVDNETPAVPIEMWNFYKESRWAARPLPDLSAYIYILASPAKGKVSRDRSGIEYRGLYYSYTEPENYIPELVNLAEKADRRLAEVDIRIDPRSINCIYYLDQNHQFHALYLNPKEDISVSFKGLSWKQYDEYQLKAKKIMAGMETKDLETQIRHDNALRELVSHTDSQYPGLNDTSDIRANRRIKKEQEKQKDVLSKDLSRANKVPEYQEPHIAKGTRLSDRRNSCFDFLDRIDYSPYDDLNI